MKLLLAEDERELSNALTAILKHNHYVVDAVYNGEDALDYILVGDYDGVILDVMMPKMDGFTVLKRVRKKGIHVPILILTAKADVDDRVTGLDSGADDYLTKPFATKELLARIRAITRRQTEHVSPVLQLGNVSLDCAVFILSCCGEQIRLPGKEFQLMELFLRCPNQFFSADTLMKKIWGYESEAEINVVWVNISCLRKKLARIGANLEIHAIRGQGYHIEIINDSAAKRRKE